MRIYDIRSRSVPRRLFYKATRGLRSLHSNRSRRAPVQSYADRDGPHTRDHVTRPIILSTEQARSRARPGKTDRQMPLDRGFQATSPPSSPSTSEYRGSGAGFAQTLIRTLVTPEDGFRSDYAISHPTRLESSSYNALCSLASTISRSKRAARRTPCPRYACSSARCNSRGDRPSRRASGDYESFAHRSNTTELMATGLRHERS